MNKEIIIIDGGSTDGTLDILRTNSDDINYWVSAPDGSVYKAFNRGLHQATGDWIIFLGSDDYLWDSAVLSKMADHLRMAYPRHLVVYAPTAKVLADGGINNMLNAPWYELSDQLATMSICHQGIFHHRKLFEAVGEYNEDFCIAGDYELLLRYLKKANPLFVPDIIVAAWEMGGISTDPQNKLKLVFERRYAIELNKLTPTWMSRVEKVLYGIYKNRIVVSNAIISRSYFVAAKLIIDLDRILRRY